MGRSEQCTKCGSDDLLTVHLAPGGRRVNFNTCRQCEYRWWKDATAATAGGTDLSEVLTQFAEG